MPGRTVGDGDEEPLSRGGDPWGGGSGPHWRGRGRLLLCSLSSRLYLIVHHCLWRSSSRNSMYAVVAFIRVVVAREPGPGAHAVPL